MGRDKDQAGRLSSTISVVVHSANRQASGNAIFLNGWRCLLTPTDADPGPPSQPACYAGGS
jgi:hypothetical protein